MVQDPVYGDPVYLEALCYSLEIENEFLSDDSIKEKRPTQIIRTNYKRVPLGRAKRDAADRLRELMFDPLERMVDLYEEVSYEIRTMERIHAGEKKGVYSTTAHASMVATKQKIINDLLPYGYTKKAEEINLNVQERMTPPKIILCGIMPNQNILENEAVEIDSESYKDAPDGLNVVALESFIPSITKTESEDE
jgi:hypothetical protein